MGTDTAKFDGAVDSTTLDGVFEAMSNAIRRELIAYLDTCEESVTFDNLVEYFSAVPADCDQRAGPADPDVVAVRLHHIHLPKLEAVGLIEISEGPAGQTVHLTDMVEKVFDRAVILRLDD